MKKLTLFYIALAATLANLSLLNPALAEDSSKTKLIEDKFKAADKDNDGRLTLDEAKAGMPRVAKGFAKIDSDNKGYVTVDQIKAMSGN